MAIDLSGLDVELVDAPPQTPARPPERRIDLSGLDIEPVEPLPTTPARATALPSPSFRTTPTPVADQSEPFRASDAFRGLGVNMGGAGKVVAAVVGDAARAMRGERPANIPALPNAVVFPKTELPVEQAIKESGLEETAQGGFQKATIPARISLGLAKSAPKIGLITATGGAGGASGFIAEMAAAGGLFGLDEEGNFHPKEAVIGALLPGVGKVARIGTGALIGESLAKGLPLPTGHVAQKLMETIGEQAAMNGYMILADQLTQSPEQREYFKQHPDEFKAHLAETIGSNLAFALFGAGKFSKEVPSATKEWVLKNSERLAARKVIESYDAETLKDIYRRVNMNDPSVTEAEKALVRMINEQLESPGEALRKGVDITEEGWPVKLAKMMDASDIVKGLRIRGEGSQAVKPKGSSLRRLLPEKGEEANAPTTEQQPSGVPIEPAGTVQVGKTQPAAKLGDRLPGPAGESLPVPHITDINAPIPPVPTQGQKPAVLTKPAEDFAKSSGWDFKPTGAVSTIGMPPEMAARVPKLWEFTDRRADSPTQSITFYVPAGSTKAQIETAYKQKTEAFARGATVAKPPEVVPAPSKTAPKQPKDLTVSDVNTADISDIDALIDSATGTKAKEPSKPAAPSKPKGSSVKAKKGQRALEPWEMTREEYESRKGLAIPAWKQNESEVFIAGQHEPWAKSDKYFDEHGFFFSRNIPDFAWDLDMRRARDHPRANELYRPMSSGVFVSMRELDAAGGDYYQALRNKVKAAPNQPTVGGSAKSALDSAKAAAEESFKALEDLFGKGGVALPLGLPPFSEQNYEKAKPHLKAAWDHFKKFGQSLTDFFNACIDRFGQTVKPYLKRFFRDLQAEAKAPPAERVREIIASDQTGQQKAVAIRKLADERGLTVKQMQEEVELEIVRLAHEIALDPNYSARQKFDALVQMYEKQPTLSARTSTSVENQAYSTPAPLSYAGSYMLDVLPTEGVYDLTAGNGMLLIGGNMAESGANEINPDRLKALQTLGLKSITQRDATKGSPEGRYPVVKLNPPFGGIPNFNYGGFGIKKLEHLIALKGLEAMNQNGRAMLILGANMQPSDKLVKGGQWVFENYLYSHYNAVSNFEVSGDLYAKQGAAWPVRVIVIAGRKDTPTPIDQIPKDGLGPKSVDRFETWDDVWHQAEKVHDEVEQIRQTLGAGGAPGIPLPPAGGTGAAPRPGRLPAPTGGTATATTGGSKPGGSAAGKPAVGTRPASGVPAPSAERPAGESAPAAPAPAQPDVGGKPNAPVEGAGGRGADTPGDAGGAIGGVGGGPKPGSVSRPPDVKGTEFQSPYIPRSEGEPFGTLTPKNIAAREAAALDALKEKFGPIDDYVANRLNMEVAELRTVMAAEQIDGVALAIHQVETGGAIIIGDQTGIGKGRQAAAMIRYARLNDMVPVFFTKDPKLFTDMYGDLKDINTSIKPAIFGDPGKASIVDATGNVIHRAPGSAGQKKMMRNILENGLKETGYDAIFITYSQVNMRNARQLFLEQLANEPTMLILDEAHEAAGKSDTSMQAAFMTGGTVSRGSGSELVEITVPGLLNSSGTKQGQGGVLYLSATYAKRPENTPVYFRTSLSKAAQSFDSIVSALKNGGVALQQAMSEALAGAGQYVRREREFTGVRYDMKRVEVADAGALTDHVDQVTDVLSQIRDFSKAIIGAVQGATAQSDESVAMTDFASIVHNQVGQLLLAAKADEVVGEALEAHRRGEKPVIALMNTMESFLTHYVDDKGIKPGDDLTLRWNELLKYALSRCLRVSEELPNGDTEIRYVNPDDYGLGDMYRRIESTAEGMESKFPISPIDYIVQKLNIAGVKMAELTGRESGLDYSDFETGKTIYRHFKRANKNEVVNGFNSGKYDGMLLNASGSTGLSAHAAAKFKDQKPRHMLIAQAALDINVFMQTLGRIFRTGLITNGVYPDGTKYGARYTHMVLPLQAEIRPASIAAKKMKSLNANTTAEADNAIKVDSADIFNRYGDRIVSEYLDENPELQMQTGVDVETRQDGTVIIKRDVAQKFMGKMALLPDSTQREVYEAVLPAYAQLLQQLKATGEYDLEIVVHDDWDGIRKADDQLKPGTDESNIFTASVRMQKWEVKDNRHVPTGAEMRKEFERNTGGAQKLGDAWRKFQADVEAVFTARKNHLQQRLAELTEEEKASALGAAINSSIRTVDMIETRWMQDTQQQVHFLVHDGGQVVELSNAETGDRFDGMLVDVKLPKLEKGKTPRVSPSAFKVKFMVDSPVGAVYATAAQFNPDKWAKDQSSKTEGELTGGKKGARYERYFVVGNPIAGYDATGGRGKMVRFRSHDGEVVTGLLMPNNWGPANLANDPRLDLVNGRAAAEFLTRYPGVIECANIVRIKRAGYGNRAYEITTSAAKRTGGDIYLDEKLRRLTGDFNKTGNKMVASVDEADLGKAVDRLMEITKERFRPVGQATETLMPQVRDANDRAKRGGKGSITPSSTPGGGEPQRGSFKEYSIEQLRTALPDSGLPEEAQRLLGAFLDLPVTSLIRDNVRVRITEALDGGWQGSYLNRLAQIARNAESLTGPEELLHSIWELLPADMKAEFERMRVASLDSLVKEARANGQEERVKVFEDLRDRPCDTQEFLDRKYPVAMINEIYPFSNADEFFAKSGSQRFKQRVGSMQEGFWAKVRAIIAQVIAAIRRALRLRPTQVEMLDRVLDGRFEPTTAETGGKRKGSQRPVRHLHPVSAEEVKAFSRAYSGSYMDSQYNRLTMAGINHDVALWFERSGLDPTLEYLAVVLALNKTENPKFPVSKEVTGSAPGDNVPFLPYTTVRFEPADGMYWIEDQSPVWQGSITREQAVKEGEAEGRLPAKTQIFGENYYIHDRERITDETTEAGSVLAKAVFDEAKIPVEQREVEEPNRPGQRRIWVAMPQAGRDMTFEGRELLKLLKREIFTQYEGNKPRDLLGNLLNSVRLNFLGSEIGIQSAFAQMNSAVRLELAAAAQSDISARGIALQAIAGFADDLKFVGKNLDIALGRIWSDTFGGDEIRRLLNELETAKADLVAAKKRMAELEAAGYGKSGAGKGAAELAREVEELRKANAALEKANADLTSALEASLKKKGRKGLRRAVKRSTRLNEKILQAIKEGGDAWDILKELAIANGWKVPTDAELAKIKAWVEEWERLEVLSPAEEARAGTDKRAQAAALREKLATLEDRRLNLRKQVETKWYRFTHPFTIRNETGRANQLNALTELASANLLLKVGFGTRQAVDIGLGQMLLYTPTRAIAQAIGIHAQEVEAGRRAKTDMSALLGDVANMLKQAYVERTRAIRPALIAAAEVARGKDKGRHVAKLMGRISLFDRAMQKADELAVAGKTGQAFLLRKLTLIQLGYRLAQVGDVLQGVPAERQEMRQQAVTWLRENGASRAEAESRADEVMEINDAERELAKAEAADWYASNGITPDAKQQRAAVERLLRAKMYEKMRVLGMPADDFEGRNLELLDTIGWNEKEVGGPGGLVADFMRGASRLAISATAAVPIAAPVTLPVIALTRFSNAIGILINRKASWTPLGFFPGIFGVHESGSRQNVDAAGIASGGSPFYRTEEDRRQRKVEAAVGTSWQAALFVLVAMGAIRVLTKWPQDKEERQLWDRMGWKPGQVHIPNGGDEHIVLSMNTGPLVVLSPGLNAGGRVHDLLEDRAKRQARMDAEAAKLGLAPGKIQPVSMADIMAVAGEAAWSSLVSGRTTSGLLASATDYGQLNIKKIASSTLSTFTPGLPGLQELDRMAFGTVLDSKMASVWDFMMPLPTSGAAQVNMLGDRVGEANALQRVVQTLTGGNYPFPVSDKERQGEASYRVLFESGYRPPSIDPGKFYAIGNDFRPFTQSELQKYTELRGKLLKEGLAYVDPSDKAGAKQAYQQANNEALMALGANTPSREPSGASGRATGQTAASGSGISARPGVRAPSRTGSSRGRGLGRLPSSIGRRGAKVRGRSLRSRRPSIRSGRARLPRTIMRLPK